MSDDIIENIFVFNNTLITLKTEKHFESVVSCKNETKEIKLGVNEYQPTKKTTLASNESIAITIALECSLYSTHLNISKYDIVKLTEKPLDFLNEDKNTFDFFLKNNSIEDKFKHVVISFEEDYTTKEKGEIVNMFHKAFIMKKDVTHKEMENLQNGKTILDKLIDFARKEMSLVVGFVTVLIILLIVSIFVCITINRKK